jgi:FkbM family methyltransferase
MHLATHLHNLHYSYQVCPTWSDRFHRMLWAYKRKSLFKKLHGGTRRFSFRYPDPITNLTVMIRDNQGSDATVFDEVFDRLYYNFPLDVEPKTILDLGANVGFSSLFFARRYPSATIACVEPMADNVRLLKENLELNGVQATDFPAAIATEDGWIEVEIATQDCGHRVASMPFGMTGTGETVRVQAVAVPSLLKEMSWERIGLLKIDIEGYEGILLKERCDWLNSVDALCLECHEGYGESDLKALALDYGFAPPQEFRGIWLLIRESDRLTHSPEVLWRD